MGGFGSSGGGGGGKSSSGSGAAVTAPSQATVTSGVYGLSKEFAADNPVRMPAPTDSALLTAARLQRDMMARSGRDSTRLVGTQVYGNVFLGSTS